MAADDGMVAGAAVIDFAAIQRLGATLRVGFDPFECAWHVSIVRDGHPTIEAADVTAMLAIDAAMAQLVAVGG